MSIDKEIRFYLTVAFYAFANGKNGMPWVDKASDRWEQLFGDSPVPHEVWLDIFIMMGQQHPKLLLRCPCVLPEVVASAYEQARRRS